MRLFEKTKVNPVELEHEGGTMDHVSYWHFPGSASDYICMKLGSGYVGTRKQSDSDDTDSR